MRLMIRLQLEDPSTFTNLFYCHLLNLETYSPVTVFHHAPVVANCIYTWFYAC